MSAYGYILGLPFGLVILVIVIITTIIVVFVVCACYHRCPLYKWRHRNDRRPVGVFLSPEEYYPAAEYRNLTGINGKYNATEPKDDTHDVIQDAGIYVLVLQQ